MSGDAPWPDNTASTLSINGRSSELFDQPDEHLYIRFTSHNWDPIKKKLDPVNLPYRFTDQSANRERFSIDSQVLFPDWPTLGVVAIQAGDMPSVRKHPVLPYVYELLPIHCPCSDTDNFAHSEIRCFRDNRFDEANRDWSKPPNKIGKEMRTDLFVEHVICREPTITHD